MLISPVLKEPKVAKETYNLTIQRKPIISVIMLIQAFFSSVPSPNVFINVPNTTLFAGSTTDLTCNVSLAKEVDIKVMLNVTWLQGSSFAATDSTLISPPNNSFTSTLTLSSLSAADKDIACSAKILPIEEKSQFLEESLPQSASETLEIMSKSII